MKYIKKYRHGLYLLLLIIGSVLFIINNVVVNNYNKKKYNSDISGENLYNQMDKSIESECTGKYQGYQQIQINDVSYDKYEITLTTKNTASRNIDGYEMLIYINDDIYMPLYNNTGKIVVSQFRNDTIYEDAVDFSNIKDSYNLEIIEANYTKYIELLSGDIITYQYDNVFNYTAEEKHTFNAYSYGQNKEMLFTTEVVEDYVNITQGVLNATVTYSPGAYLDLYGLDDYPHYPADTINYSINNKSNNVLKNIEVTINISSSVFLTSVWDGCVEIHQFDGGNEKICSFDNFNIIRTFTDDELNDLNINYIKNVTEIYIPLNAGDYIVYTPSANTYSVNGNSSYEFGFMFFHTEENTINGFNVSLKYMMHENEYKTNLFYGALYLMLVTTLIFLADVFATVRYRSYKKKAQKDEEALMESMNTFTSFIDAKDKYTEGHSRRVAQTAKLMALELNMSPKEAQRIYYIGLMHDCGKIGIPDSILSKPNGLTPEEYEIVKSHTTRGGQILSGFHSIKDIQYGALYHHEMYNGNGYPEGLKGEEIPLVARIVTVCDSFDTMNSTRVYRARLKKAKIIEELTKGKGTQFDPKLADIMIKLINEGKVYTID